MIILSILVFTIKAWHTAIPNVVYDGLFKNVTVNCVGFGSYFDWKLSVEFFTHLNCWQYIIEAKIILNNKILRIVA